MMRVLTRRSTDDDEVEKRRRIVVDENKGECEAILCLVRAPYLSMLTVESGRSVLFKPFKSPLEGHQPGKSQVSVRMTLGARPRRGLCAGSILSFKSPPKVEVVAIPDDERPLVLYRPKNDAEVEIKVDPILTKSLREHQRQGVQFVFECLMGMRDFDGQGCILADDMGLGKTLQSITVLWTLLQQGIDGKPTIRRAVIVCPASLVNNWASEIQKWLDGKCCCTPVADTVKEKVVAKFEGFRYDHKSRVLISSYETFRTHANRLERVPVDLVICDEAHRLKNDKTKTNVAINELPARRRLLLSGTPIQNDLDEFFTLVSLCNPNLFGDASSFRKKYALPILTGREPDASEDEQQLASERLSELSSITNKFILRRTNALLAKVLPPKVIMNVFCRLTPIQERLYNVFLESKSCQSILQAEECGKAPTGRVLASIQGLMKLCNHPLLVKNQTLPVKGFERGIRLLDELDVEGTKSRHRSIRPELSGKMLVLCRLLHEIRNKSKDKVVLISNYTQTLDIFESICRVSGYPLVRLDGSTSIKKRHDIITKFNDPTNTMNSFAFLLSSKAGGCGVNLVGANRLVLFDPDWNPAVDRQALARVWRDGQKKTCYIYRFFASGTIEEKVYQRQICKDGLSAMIVSEGDNSLKDSLSAELVRDLFVLKNNILSDTHDMIGCTRCAVGDKKTLAPMVPQLPAEVFDEDDLLTWSHHADMSTIPDQMLQEAAATEPLEDIQKKNGVECGNCTSIIQFSPVSFVMSCKIVFDPKAPEKKPKQVREAIPENMKCACDAAESERDESLTDVSDFELNGEQKPNKEEEKHKVEEGLHTNQAVSDIDATGRARKKTTEARSERSCGGSDGSGVSTSNKLSRSQESSLSRNENSSCSSAEFAEEDETSESESSDDD